MSELWKSKEYPQESKERIDEIIKQTSDIRKNLDDIDKQLLSHEETPSYSDICRYARKAGSYSNFLKKIVCKLQVILEDEEAVRLLEIKDECMRNKVKFHGLAGTAEKDAIHYTKHIRLALYILKEYINSADNIISICRLHVYSKTNQQVEI